jgi:CheY-like chemotaxis protein
MLEIRSLARAKHSKKIVCVEDNDFVLNVLELYLQSRGFAVVPCSSGTRALELLNIETPDAITLDFKMPDMDGAQLAAAIHARNPRMPIVMFSDSTDISQATLKLVDRFISKDAANGFAAVADALDCVLSRKNKSRHVPAKRRARQDKRSLKQGSHHPP